MVTKEYLDDKISDLRGDLVSLVRKEDTKVVAFARMPFLSPQTLSSCHPAVSASGGSEAKGLFRY